MARVAGMLCLFLLAAIVARCLRSARCAQGESSETSGEEDAAVWRRRDEARALALLFNEPVEADQQSSDSSSDDQSSQVSLKTRQVCLPYLEGFIWRAYRLLHPGEIVQLHWCLELLYAQEAAAEEAPAEEGSASFTKSASTSMESCASSSRGCSSLSIGAKLEALASGDSKLRQIYVGTRAHRPQSVEWRCLRAATLVPFSNAPRSETKRQSGCPESQPRALHQVYESYEWCRSKRMAPPEVGKSSGDTYLDLVDGALRVHGRFCYKQLWVRLDRELRERYRPLIGALFKLLQVALGVATLELIDIQQVQELVTGLRQAHAATESLFTRSLTKYANEEIWVSSMETARQSETRYNALVDELCLELGTAPYRDYIYDAKARKNYRKRLEQAPKHQVDFTKTFEQLVALVTHKHLFRVSEWQLLASISERGRTTAALYSGAIVCSYMRNTRSLVSTWGGRPSFKVVMRTDGAGRARQRDDLSTEHWPYPRLAPRHSPNK